MKKYIIGTIFGVLLATATSAHAEVTSLINKVVEGMFPVTVEGTSIGEAVVIDNKTYLPVREFGEAVGYTVSFTESREVVLTKNEEPVSTIPTEPVVTPQPTVPTKTVAEQITDLKIKIAYEKESIEHNKIMMGSNEGALTMPNAPKESVQQAIDMYKVRITDSEKNITQYEAQIVSLEAQK